MSESLIRQQEALEAARNASLIKENGIGRFSGQPSALSQSLASRQFHDLTPARMERREAMNQPYQSHIVEPVQSGISSALLLSRMNTEAIEKQARFFALLESEYGAIKGNDKSYEDAINKYLDNEESMRLANQQRMEEKLKKEREGIGLFQGMYNTFVQRNYKSQSGSRAEQEEQRRYEEEHRRRQEEQRKDAQRAQREWEQYHRQQQGHQQQHSYARGGPAQEPQRPSGKRPKMQINKALAFMGIDRITEPTARDIKLAFNKKLLLLHPDKNLGNEEKKANKFRRMRKAYNSLTNKGESDSDTSGSMGGSTLRRNRKGNKTRKNTRKK